MTIRQGGIVFGLVRKLSVYTKTGNLFQPSQFSGDWTDSRSDLEHFAISMTQRSTNQPSISLCMIALNDESCIVDAINSCIRSVDEVIVVDGGSSDGTARLASSLGARVIVSPWEDSFSIARNLSFQAARCDWIFVLDCDERLRASSSTRLQSTVQNADTVAFTIHRHEWRRGATAPSGKSRFLRLGRRDAGCTLRRRIHEVPCKPLESVGRSEIEIDHLGYAVSNPEKKFARNVKLLQMQLREDPDDQYLWADLAYHYFSRQDNRWVEPACRALERLDLTSTLSPHALASSLLEIVLRAPEKTRLPISCGIALSLAERWYPCSLPMLALRVRDAVNKKRDPMAIDLGERAIRLNSEQEEYGEAVSFDRAVVVAELHLLTGFAHMRLRHFSDAAQHFRKCVNHPYTVCQANQYMRLLPQV